MNSDKSIHPTSGYSRLEEWANSLTHGIGILLAAACLTISVVFASLDGDPYLIVATAIYGASMICLYTASTLYHSARDLKWKTRFLIFDHSSIYLLIAGTYTPFCLGPLRGPLGWSLFGVVWGLAFLGIIRELFARKRGGLGSAIIFLAMGWIVVGFVVPLYYQLSTFGFTMLVIGGLTYTIGVIFYLWKSLKFHHAIWHLFVVGGATFQFFAVLSLIL